ncbi:3-hydroxyacyl-CoA dehydrogenase family protein [Paenarthrobacter ureafaciens]|uniref:3-hydroxyacyl-CoA dehydrogenase family protein n=1 Tax=Paenarthrobacter ureafaciens TaxID=37931 RepID=UPI002DBCCC2B|nr:3-hydroxyacyl-CoA dehydrogenase family protein [Paenarthrobacter ureafaciens]MEC3853692.1 3-hydroxyacyl-CoA dehydrogenase family protein [Paenarthrobacter ureafaciens]
MTGTDSMIPNNVGVLGGGRMGAGIAHAFLIKGATVTVVERDSDAARAANERLAASVDASFKRGAISGDRQAVLNRLNTTTDHSYFASCGLVIEAVPEDVGLKTSALIEVERHLSSGAFLATNTSSLSVSGLAKSLTRPESFLGLHFFNPVPASTLIEVVVGDKTEAGTVDAARAWVAGLDKTAVVVKDAPGFASSRLGVAIALEAMRMVEEGVASAEDIDNAMVLGYKHPVGPLRTTDIVGLDVRLGIAEYLESTLGPRFAPPNILREKVAAGALGRKAGKGFYEWTN